DIFYVYSFHYGTPVLGRYKRYGFLGLTAKLDNDTKTYGEMMLNINSGKWVEAMKSEIDSMSLNKLWTWVDLPKGVIPIGYKWINKCKLGSDREVTTFKAVLVAKGYTQRVASPSLQGLYLP
ncbi:UNVERIFIED_CONTAM: hypothetical protein Sindi_2883300, partial [Sesamum indicum]